MKNIAITENHLYQKAYHKGKRHVSSSVAVYVLRDYAAARLMRENPQKQFVNRLGLSVSKKLGSAVVRNRAKRVMRAAYREIEGDLTTGYLVVIAARGGICGKKSQEVKKELSYGFRKLGLLAEKGKEQRENP